jgi:hypothetical protein
MDETEKQAEYGVCGVCARETEGTQGRRSHAILGQDPELYESAIRCGTN